VDKYLNLDSESTYDYVSAGTCSIYPDVFV